MKATLPFLCLSILLITCKSREPFVNPPVSRVKIYLEKDEYTTTDSTLDITETGMKKLEGYHTTFDSTVTSVFITDRGDTLHGAIMGDNIKLLFYNVAYNFYLVYDHRNNTLRHALSFHRNKFTPLDYLNKTR